MVVVSTNRSRRMPHICGVLSGLSRHIPAKTVKGEKLRKNFKYYKKTIDKYALQVYNVSVVEPKTAGYRKSIRAILPRRDLYRNIV